VGAPVRRGHQVSDLAWFRPDGQQMTPSDWHRPEVHTLGMYLDGQQIRHRDPRGQRIIDDSYLLWLNAGPSDVDVTLPGWPWSNGYTVVLDTSRPEIGDGTPGDPETAEGTICLRDHSVVLLRAVR
jgi:isoamylase